MGVFGLFGSTASAQPYPPYGSHDQIDIGVFYNGLSPYGDWVEMPDYGWAWAPRVDYGWRPYTMGQWVWTDEDGWYWDSDERFGWAAYHYGRWVDDPYYGWIWVPGYEWGPSWVSWRHGNGYVGWAPLPPRARWSVGVGLSLGGLDIDAFLPVRDYNFVPERNIVERGAYRHVVPYAQNITIINITNNVTNYTVVNERVVNRGPAPELIERNTGQLVTRVRVTAAGRPDDARRVKDDELAVFRADVKLAVDRPAPRGGRSLVRGDAPPPQLVERRKLRERELQDASKQALAVAVRDAEKASGQPQREQARQKQAEAQQREQQQEQDKQRQLDQERQQKQKEQEQQQLRDRQQQQQDQDRQRHLELQKQQEDNSRQKQLEQQLEQKQRQQEQQELDRRRRDQQQEQNKQKQLDQQRQQKQKEQEQQQLDQQRRDQQQQKKDKAKASPSPTPPPKSKDKKNSPDDQKPPAGDR
jgi:hypothetical protein